MKKVVKSIFATFIAIFSMANVLAANVAKIGNVEYATIDAAVAAWKEGDEIKLLCNIDIADYFVKTKNFVIDGCGYTLKCTKAHDGYNYFVNNNGYTQTFKNITIDGNKKVAYAVQCINTSSTLILDNVTIKGGKTKFSLSDGAVGYGLHINKGNVFANNLKIYDCDGSAVYIDSNKAAGGSFTLTGDNCDLDAVGIASGSNPVLSITAKGFCFYDVKATYTYTLPFIGTQTASKTLSNVISPMSWNQAITIIEDKIGGYTIKSATVTLKDEVNFKESFTSNESRLTIEGAGKTVTGKFIFNSSTPTTIKNIVLGNGSVLDCTASTKTGFSGVSVAANTSIDILLPASTDMNSYALPVALATDAVANIFVGEKKYIAKNGVISSAEKLAQIGDKQYATLQEAINAANGATVQVLKDVALTSSLTVPAGKTLTLNLAGRKVTVSGADYALVNNGNLKIVDMGLVTVVAAEATIGDETATPILIMAPSANDGVAVIDDATGGSIAGVQNNGTFTLESGAVVAASASAPAIDNTVNAVATITGGTVEGKLQSVDKTALTITGGSFTGESNVSDFVGGDYGVDENGAIVKNVAKIGETGYLTLEDAVAAAQAGDTIVLAEDIAISKPIILSKNVTIDGGNKTITPAADFVADGNLAVIVFANGATAYSVDRNYTVKNLTIEGFSGLARVLRANFCDSLIENCSFVNNSVSEGVVTTSYGKTNVKDCTFDGNTSAFSIVNIGFDVSSGTELAVTVDRSEFIGNKAAIALIYAASSVAVTDNYFNGNVHSGNNANAAAVLAGPYTGTVSYTVDIKENAFVNAFGQEGGNALPDVFAEDWSEIHNATTSFDLSSNYWNGGEPNYAVSGKPSIDLTDYYTTYADGVKGGLTEVKVAVAKIGEQTYETLADAVAAAQSGDEIVLLADVTLDAELTLPAGIKFNGNGKTVAGTIKAGGNLEFVGNTIVSTFNPGWYNNVITIGAGASLKATSGRMTVSYGNTFNITGSIADGAAKTADKTTITPSLELVGGISFNGNGGGVNFNVINAYVKLGDSTTKNSGATGEFNLNFTNSIVDFTKTLKTYMPTVTGLAPAFKLNAVGSVIDFASHLEFWLNNTTVALDATKLTVGGSFANAGTLALNNNSEFIVKAPIMSSHGGNTGTITVNSGTFELVDSNEAWQNAGTMTVGATGTLKLNDFKCVNEGVVSVDVTGMNVGTSIADRIVLNSTNTDFVYSNIKTTGSDLLVVDDEGKLAERPLVGSGTEADPFVIASLADLELFRAKVNGGNSFAGKFVKMTADINLGNAEWTPIAKFNGTFDGDNHKISNLRVVGNGNVGFFKQVADQTEYVSGTVKNVTFENATIISESGEGNAGLIALAPMGARITNVRLTGNVNIQGYRGVGGIVGSGFPVMTDCSVEAEGTIHATYWGVGGILGFANDKGAKVYNATVKGVGNGLTISSYLGGVGGVTGTPYGAATTGATVSNVTISSSNNYYMAYVDAGGAVSGTVVVEDVVVKVNGEAIIGNDAVTSIGDSVYFSLSSAIFALKDGDSLTIYAGEISEGTIKFPAALKNVTIKGETGAILKDMTLMASDGGNIAYEGITFDGIVFDNANILFSGQRASASYKDWTIANCEFKNVARGSAAVSFNLNTSEAMENFTFTNNVIDGVTGGNYSGLVLRASKGSVVISGNDIKNVVWNAVQLLNSTADTLTITDNKFASGADEGILNLYGVTATTLTIKENQFLVAENQPGVCYIESADVSLNYWGGEAPANLPEGVIYTNYYTIYDAETGALGGLTEVKIAVAKIGEETFETIEAAFAAAQNGDTVTLLSDVELNETLVVAAGKSVTLDLAGFAIESSTTAFDVSGALTLYGGTLIVTDSSKDMFAVAAEGSVTLKHGQFSSDVTGFCADGVICVKQPSGLWAILPDATVETLNPMVLKAGEYSVLEDMKWPPKDPTEDSYLGVVMRFTANDTEETIAESPFKDYATDFYITISGMEGDSFIADENTFLVGNYGDFGWIKIPLKGMKIENGVRYPVLGSVFGDSYFTYEFICTSVREMLCAMTISPEIIAANPNLKVVLDLAVTEDPESGEEPLNVGGYDYSAEAFMPAAARIGEVYYRTLADALAAAQTGDTVVLLAEATGDVTVAEGCEVVIDLNGNDIVGTLNAIVNNGTLTINDTVGTGNVYTTDVSAQGRAAIVNRGTIVINGGWFGDANNDTSDRNAINRGNALKNYGTAIVNGGYFTNVSNQYIGSDAYAYAINTLAGGTTVINEATVYGDINGLIYSDGKTTVNGGSFTLGRPGEENNLWYLAYGDVVIKGGTWARAFKVPSWNTSDPKFNGNVVISGGDFNIEIPETYRAEGYQSVKQPGKDLWQVGKLPNAEVINVGPYTVDEESYYIYNITNKSFTSGHKDEFDLQVTLGFIANDTVEEAAANAYGQYLTDFRIKIEGIENGSFVADGDCYLAGYYPFFGGWVKVNLDGMTIKNNVGYPVITGVTEMPFTYETICDIVKSFICGIHLSDEVLQANPNLKVSLELGLAETQEKMLNGSGFITVGDTYDYTAEEMRGPVALVGPDYFTSFADAVTAAIASGEEVKVVANTVVSDEVVINKNLSVDLNGKTLTMAADASIKVENAAVKLIGGTFADLSAANIALSGNATLTLPAEVDGDFGSHFTSENSDGSFSIATKFQSYIQVVDNVPCIGFLKDTTTKYKLMGKTALDDGSDWAEVSVKAAAEAVANPLVPLYWAKPAAGEYRFFKVVIAK